MHYGKGKKMTQTIHPIFTDLSISESAKIYFTDKKFEEIIEDAVHVDSDNGKIEEPLNNYWRFSVNQDNCSKNDIN